MLVHIPNQGAVQLTQHDFLAQGGEGQIYVRGGTAYKVYLDPSKMVPLGKIQELAAITDPNVIKPTLVLLDDKKKHVGYTMRYVPNTVVLCQTFTRAFRDRNNITPDTMLALVQNLQGLVQNVHQANAFVVDLNEMNFLVGQDFKEVYGIDVDSYKTPHYPPTALMESVRDRHSPNLFNEGTDWFAFGIVSFQMLIGIHPYKGKHPKLHDLDDRMTANISVLNSAVRIPKVCYPIQSIPEVYLRWYRATFDEGKRLPPPSGLHASVVLLAPKLTTLTGQGHVKIVELWDYGSPVRGAWSHLGQLAVLTDEALYHEGRRVWNNVSQEKVAGIGFAPKSGRPIVMTQSRARLDVVSPTGHVTPFGLDVSQVTNHDGHVYVKNGKQVLEVSLAESGDRIVSISQVAVNVSEQSSRCFEGVVLQDVFGSMFVSLLVPSNNAAYQLRVQQLEGHKLVDAKFDRGVLMVVVAQSGKYHRFVFRFDENYVTYDVRKVENITPVGLNFVVLDTGVCVCLNEDEALEVFSSKKDSAAMKVVADDVLSNDMKLYRHGGKLLFTRGQSVYHMTLS